MNNDLALQRLTNSMPHLAVRAFETGFWHNLLSHITIKAPFTVAIGPTPIPRAKA